MTTDPPPWFEEYTRAPENPRDAVNPALFQWILTRPKKVQALLCDWPPACVVRVKATGEFLILNSILGGDDELPSFSVKREPRGQRLPEEYMPHELDPVAAWKGVDGKLVREILTMAGYEPADSPAFKPPVERVPNRLTRNSPCRCGSGKKIKFCHPEYAS